MLYIYEKCNKKCAGLQLIKIQNFKYTYVTGMHFSQSVSIIQSQVGVIRGVQVLYSDTVSIRCFILIYKTYIHNTQKLYV